MRVNCGLGIYHHSIMTITIGYGWEVELRLRVIPHSKTAPYRRKIRNTNEGSNSPVAVFVHFQNERN